MGKKKAIVFFDLEREDGVEAMPRIQKVLDKYNIRACFNTVGAIAERHPGLIKELHNKGHEIASHGYRHENFAQLSKVGIVRSLKNAEDAFMSIIGTRPIGFRAPALLYNNTLYEVLAKRGYRWASNKYIFRTEPLRGASLLKRIYFGVHWRMYNKSPYMHNGVLEIPILTSFDVDLLQVMPSFQDSSKEMLNSAVKSLKRQCGRDFNLNFHPWLIGTRNRILVLKEVLDHVSDAEFMLPRDLVFRRLKKGRVSE